MLKKCVLNLKKFREIDTYLAILVPTGAVSLTSKSPFPPLSINLTNCPSIMLKPLTTISSFLIISWGLFLGMFWLVVFSSALVLDVLLATLTTLFAVPQKLRIVFLLQFLLHFYCIFIAIFCIFIAIYCFFYSPCSFEQFHQSRCE